VLYVNDSKATNVASALAGIGAFEDGLHLILGGSLKGESFRPLAGPVSDRAVAVYLIGAAADDLVMDLASIAVSGVHIQRSGTLEQAVEDASAAASEGQVVLLSPACASFDAFRDFEERGDRFRELVEALP
jgi:UDP-N-acetylmuramoylalanine--D-glutamate ligase